jgi:hypothetical protein
MRNFSKIGFMILGLLAAALLVGSGLGLWLSHRNIPKLTETTTTAVSNPKPSLPISKIATNAPDEENNHSEAASDDEPLPMATVDEKLDSIILSDADASVKSSRILALMPQATPEQQVELSQHLVNLVDDENYTATGELLANPTTSRDVSSVLLNDLLNRNNKLKLPMLLAVARVDDHPLKNEAHDMLELFIQEDKGTNWAEWETAINTWLKDNEPDAAPTDTPVEN